MLLGGIEADREVWVELHDRSVRAHLSRWHQVQRGPFSSDVAWVGRVQYPRPDGDQFDGLTPERMIRQVDRVSENDARQHDQGHEGEDG